MCICAAAGAYGFCHMPTASGTYEIDCPTWLPEVSSTVQLCSGATGSHMQRPAAAPDRSATTPSPTRQSDALPTPDLCKKCMLCVLVLRASRCSAGYSLRGPALSCPALLQGSLGERVSAFFIGGNPRLVSEETVHSPGDRFRLQTVARGVVQLQLGEWGAAAADALHCTATDWQGTCSGKGATGGTSAKEQQPGFTPRCTQHSCSMHRCHCAIAVVMGNGTNLMHRLMLNCNWHESLIRGFSGPARHM